MTEDEQRNLDELVRGVSAEGDQISCIEVLEVLLCVECLPSLVEIIADNERPRAVRQRAAIAISRLGPGHVRRRLNALRSTLNSEVVRLVNLATSVDGDG